MINVTKTFLPPLKDYMEHVEKAFDKAWLTNRGNLVKDLENKLCEHLSVEWILLMTNGTLPIQIALKVLGQQKEIITTPFSYVATTSAIIWENCTPVFVDIHPEYLTIDERKIEDAITENTTAILATHVYGNPCNVEEIERIAQKFDLAVIYDAAHCFGVDYKGKSIFRYGDVSTCSFHATKLFHTAEGGAVFCNNKKLQNELFYGHNFSHISPTEFHGVGINGKMSELQAAMGLSVLPYINEIVEDRKKIVERYNSELNFSKISALKLREGTSWNYSYYPVLFESEDKLQEVIKSLSDNEIFARRYFYPSLNNLEFIRNKEQKCPISESISSRVLCLPLYYGMMDSDQEKIIDLINLCL
ncbi:MAG: DegT/DnrJ/EryC1/StrS family aminotransferase [Flavobacteriales bacterium]|nr:DegT/DnrJ/EryC1/StrS family aminotransferase [Flavobacteriales bacterium]